MKTSYKELFAIHQALTVATTKDGKQVADKLTYAAKKNLKTVESLLQGYNEKAEDIQIEYCATDDQGLIIEPKKYNKENEKLKLAALKKLAEQHVEFEPFFAANLSRLRAIPYNYLETLAGVLFPESELEKMIED